MSTIAIVTHHADDSTKTRFLVESLSRIWAANGHRVTVTCDLDRLPGADIAFLHVDLSVIPDSYASAMRRYQTVINGDVLDIRKRRVSRQILCRTDNWSGPVIIKSDLNAGGSPEWRAHNSAIRRGLPPIAAIEPNSRYQVLRNLRKVPDEVWADSGLVVERYLPERAGLGYHVRTWIFFGEQEYCVRRFGYHRIIKGHNTVRCEAAEVPDELRAERERLRFDFGKFDFVVPNGVPILLDANKTPAIGSKSPAGLHEHLARGISSFIRSDAAVHSYAWAATA